VVESLKVLDPEWPIREAVITEYEQAQEAFQRNFRRLRAEGVEMSE
jgi:hypothetical protein